MHLIESYLISSDSRAKRRSSVYSSLLAMALGFSFFGCGALKKGTVLAPRTDTTTPAASTETVQTSCISKVIDRGIKGTVAAVTRGAYADIKTIPGTDYSAVAYVDAGALSVKLNWDDGTDYNTEIVSGDGAAAWVRLALLSDKTPIVLWVSGTSLKAAIRSAPLTTTTATWTAGIIDTGTAPRAVEVAVNPLDEIGVTFLTDTATAGKAKFLWCAAPCTNPNSFKAMEGTATTAVIENNTIGAAQTATGIAWCKVSSSVYYPAVVYTSATNTAKYAVCRNSNLNNCLTSTGWTLQNVQATASSVANSVYIDQTVVGDVPKVLSRLAGGVTTYLMSASTSCAAVPAAFTAGSTLTASSNTGTLWMKLLASPAGKFQLVANDSTTSVRYYTSQTTSFNGTWDTHGVIETTTLPAASSGGADIDSVSGGIYVGYGQNVANYDVRLSRIADYTLASSSGSQTYSNTSPDQTGGIQLIGASLQQMNISAAKTSAGKFGVAYVDFSVGAAANAKLKYAYRNAIDSSASWDVVQVPGTTNPQFPGLAFDNQNRPWISYFEANSNRFYLTRNSQSDGSGSWVTYAFPAIPAGAPVALPAANATQVAMVMVGSTYYPVMIVIDTNAGSKGVKAARFNPNTTAWSAVTSIDGMTLGALGASNLSSAWSATAGAAITYRENNVTRARYASTTDGLTWSGPYTVSSQNGSGAGADIALNPANSYSPAISYYDRANNRVYVSTCSGTLTSCASGGWSSSIIDNTAGVSGLASAQEQVLGAPIGYTPQGKIYVGYVRGQANDGSFKLWHNFSGYTVPDSAMDGANGALVGLTALNFGISGMNGRGLINSDTGMTFFHIGPGNWLYTTGCGE